MTTERYHRCAQCGDEYIFQGSGPGCGRAENDAKWCPSCKGIVDQALANVPRRFECRYRPTSEIPGFEGVTLEMIKTWETEPDPYHIGLDGKPMGPPLARRIWPGLVNVQTGDMQNIREVRSFTNSPYRGKRFRVSTWRDNPEFSIELSMEYDLREQRFTGGHWPH